MNPRKSLYLKIILSFLTIALIPLLASSFISYFQVRQNTYNIIKRDMSHLIDELGVIVQGKVLDAVRHVALLAESSVIRSDNIALEEKTREMQKIYDLIKLFDDITLLDREGIVLTSLKYDFRGDWKYKKWFKSSLEGKLAVSPVHIITQPTRFVIIVTAPIFGDDKKVKAVLAGRIGMERIWEMTDKIKIGSTGFIFITDDFGKVLSWPDKDKILYKIMPENLRAGLLSGDSGAQEFIGEKNVPKLCFSKTLKENTQYAGEKWHIGVIQDKAETYVIINRMILQIALIAVVCVLAICVLAFILGKRIVRPIKSLVKASENVALGDLNSKVEITSNDEIGELGKSFNLMVRDLKKTTVSIEVLEREQKRFQDIALNTGEWIWEVDIEGRYTYSSPAVEQILGYKPEAVIGRHFYDFFRPDKKEELKEAAFAAFSTKAIFKNFSNYNVRKDGGEVIIETSGSPILDADGRLLGYRGVDRDITERKLVEDGRKKAEEELKSAYEQLKATQAKLVQSAKMASIGTLAGGVAHEINNPLTGVLNNVQLIKMMAQGQTGFNIDDFQDILGIIEAAALRCKNITQSLLSFSHASKGEFVSLSMNEAIEKVVGLIEHELKLQNINIQKELQPDLPLISGDFQLMQQLVLDIISNAKWAVQKKFSQDGGFINIKTQYEPQARSVCVYISDNGIGIPQENLDKIFEPFFTTKTIGEGTGLGLSIIYNIVKAHQGTIEVESRPELGVTTFKIRLPAA